MVMSAASVHVPETTFCSRTVADGTFAPSLVYVARTTVVPPLEMVVGPVIVTVTAAVAACAGVATTTAPSASTSDAAPAVSRRQTVFLCSPMLPACALRAPPATGGNGQSRAR